MKSINDKRRDRRESKFQALSYTLFNNPLSMLPQLRYRPLSGYS